MTDTRRVTIPERHFAAHEHRELRQGIERIHEAGSLRGTNDELSISVLGVLHWVDAVLGPHAEWEIDGSIRRSTVALARIGRRSS